jgi:hypothetical protein
VVSNPLRSPNQFHNPLRNLNPSQFHNPLRNLNPSQFHNPNQFLNLNHNLVLNQAQEA